MPDGFDLTGFSNALGVKQQSPITDELLNSLRRVESGKDPYAVNKETKAMGAYQFMPDTVAMLHKQGVKFNPFDEKEAKEAARTYLEQLTAKNGGDVNKALAQYGGFITKDPSQYVGKVLGGQQAPQVQSQQTQMPQSNQFDLSGFEKSLNSNLAPQQLQNQLEEKQTANKQPIPNVERSSLNKADQQLQEMFGQIPGVKQLQAGAMGAGSMLSNTGSALGQMAGKAVGMFNPEMGQNIENFSTTQARKTEQIMQPYEQQQPIATTVGKVAGAVLNPINKVLPGGGGILPGIAQGSIANVLTTPVTDDNKAFLSEKLRQAFVGGVAGGVGAGLVGAATSLAQPIKNELGKLGENAVKTLRDAGVPIDVAQATGSTVLNRLKASFSDNPFTAGKQEAFQSTQKSAYNNAIAKTMGENADAITPIVIQRAKSRLGNVYDDVASRNNIHLDKELESHLSNIRSEAEDLLNPDQFRIVNKQIDNIISKAEEKGGGIHGEQYQSIKKVLDKLSGSRDTDVGNYAREIKDSLLDGLSRTAEATGNRADVELLKQTNRQYGNMKKIEDVVLKDPNGNVSPSLLMNSLSTKGKRYSFYQDDPQLAELASAGKLVLEQKLPNSGTYARFLAGNPLTAAALSVKGKVAQNAMENPTIANYLEKGLPQGGFRSVLEVPANVGQAIPTYARKPGIAGQTALNQFINLRNQEQK
jgi:hypothetical protein